jgi:hypothetical protein
MNNHEEGLELKEKPVTSKINLSKNEEVVIILDHHDRTLC